VTRVFSIFERIGLGGGGKVKAIYHRMNALAEMVEFDPVLLNLDHSPRQKLNFAELQESGVIAKRVRCVSVPEACLEAAVAAGVQPFDGFPDFDRKEVKGKKTEYYRRDVSVMVDRTKSTLIGEITKRRVPDPKGELLYTLIDGEVYQLIQRKADGITETTDYVQSLPVRWLKTQDGKFVIGRNLISDTICRMERIYGQNVYSQIEWGSSVVFFDGVTSAYLAPVTNAQRALFLHADHRGPSGDIVPRSKYLIENFKGEAIITSTQVHKVQIEADVVPAAPVHVIPHFSEIPDEEKRTRRNLVTVSRLELTGKPIDECIEAFCLIKDEFPSVEYLIFGLGAGQAKLEAQIEALECGDRVQLAGYTTDPSGVFQSAIASVYPTMTEGFGLSILEALSNGCPVISYDVNYGPREMIRSGQNGELVPPNDIASIAEAMRHVLLQSEQYQDATKIGLERYTRKAYLTNYRDIVCGLKNGID
jgi:glycosyltransferase involved in cell wall biosynthesis